MVKAEVSSSTEEAAVDIQSMDAFQIALHKRLVDFSLDSTKDDLPFSERLARDNGWRIDYAIQAIEEYKRFAFLAVVADHPVTPSDQVDQVWHLHLAYTRAYWDDFCPNILKRQLPHTPTKGGDQEAQKFDKWYNQTLQSYEQFFGQCPPVKIWPISEDRFGRDLQFVRVNAQQNWVVPKPSISRKAVSGIFAVLVALGSCYYAVTVKGIQPTGAVALAAFFAFAGFSFVQTIATLLDAFDGQPPRPFVSDGGCGGVSYGCGGCGGGGCGG